MLTDPIPLHSIYFWFQQYWTVLTNFLIMGLLTQCDIQLLYLVMPDLNFGYSTVLVEIAHPVILATVICI